jgi:hypothetical protein
VAVIGASAEDGKIGNSVMKNLINGGYKGEIYPIHPKAAEILGYKAYKSVKDVPGVIPASFVPQGELGAEAEADHRYANGLAGHHPRSSFGFGQTATAAERAPASDSLRKRVP